MLGFMNDPNQCFAPSPLALRVRQLAILLPIYAPAAYY